MTNLLAHLNLRLIFKYVYLSKEDGMDKSEIKFMIEQLYKGLIDAIDKWDPKAGAYTTYAFNRVLNKFTRGTIYVVRERYIKKQVTDLLSIQLKSISGKQKETLAVICHLKN